MGSEMCIRDRCWVCLVTFGGVATGGLDLNAALGADAVAVLSAVQSATLDNFTTLRIVARGGSSDDVFACHTWPIVPAHILKQIRSGLSENFQIQLKYADDPATVLREIEVRVLTVGTGSTAAFPRRSNLFLASDASVSLEVWRF